MSGAEVLVAVGATSSVITICQTCVTIVRFIQKYHISETTARLKPQVELLAQTITQLKPLNLGSSAPELSAVLNGCEQELRKLSDILEKYQQASSGTLLRRARRSFRIPIWEERIRETWIGIQQYQSTIGLYLEFHNTKRLLNAPYTGLSLYLVPCYLKTETFGRQDIFDRVSGSINLCTHYPCILSLTGLPGIGKTQITLQLCLRARTTYSVIVWISAESESRLTQDVCDFAHKLSRGERSFNNREDSWSYIHEVAKNRSQPWFLVFDDWDSADLKPDSFKFLADGRQRDVIVTTTRKKAPSLGTQIQIPPLPEKNAMDLVLCQSQYPPSVEDMEAARDLLRVLGHTPIILSTVSAHMRSKGSTPRRVLEELGMYLNTDQLDGSKIFARGISLSLGSIRREDSRLVDFLLQLSFIAVPAEFLFRGHFLAAQSRGEPLPTFYQLFVHDKQWSSERFLHAVMRLATYALVKEELIGETGFMVLSLHRLVRVALQSELLPTGTSLSLQLMFHTTAIIASSLAAHDWEELSSHLRRVFRENILECVQQRNSIISDPENVRKYSGILEGYQTAFGAFLAMYSNEEKEARDLLQESLGLQSTWIGESAPLTCTTMTWLALLYLEIMSLDEAEAMINRLDTAEAQAPKSEEVSLADVQFLNGHLAMRKQKIDHAVSVFKRCTGLYANITGVACISTASALISGVEAMMLQGNVEDATQALYDAEHIEKEIDSPHALAIRVKWNLARHSLRMGDYVRAISCYKDLCEEHESHHDQAGSPFHRWESLHCELGDVYLHMGDMQNAQLEYEIGRASASRRLGIMGSTDAREYSQWLIYGSLVRAKALTCERIGNQLVN